MPQVVIIGAGLTGLSVAYHLENSNFFDYVILEREPVAGGLCRSVRQDGFTFDYTGHLLHLSNAYAHKLVHQLMPPESFNTHERNSWIYNGGHVSKYPFQANLRGQPPAVIAACIESFVKRKKISNPRSFYAWVCTHFGKGFAEHFFVPYQEKIFCCDTKKLSHTWTGRFVPNTSLVDIVSGILDQDETRVGYNAHFYYPKSGGIDCLINAFLGAIVKPILFEHAVKSIDVGQKVITCANGHTERYGVLVNTAPLDWLVAHARVPSSLNVTSARRNLRASNVLNINVGVQNLDIFNKHWLYVVDRTIPFYRAGFAHVLSKNMAPDGCGSLYIEHAYRGELERGIEQKIVTHAQKLFGFSQSDTVTYNELRLEPAYVTYTFWRDKNVSALLERLKEYGIFSVGRYGAWQYASMQEAILEGRAVAQGIMHVQNELHVSERKEKELELA